MLTRSDTPGRYDAVWREAEPYMRARKNDVHIPLSFAFAQALLKLHPDADEDIVSLAILLHDIGWWSIDMTDIIEKGFGPNMMQSDVRFLHEKEGVRLSRACPRGRRRDHRRPRHAAVSPFAQRPVGARCRQALALHGDGCCGRLR